MLALDATRTLATRIERALRRAACTEQSRVAVCATVNVMVNDPFRALSHPIRRGIVERLAPGPATVGDATHGFGVSKPAITKHLKVLEETGVVSREIEGRTHWLTLELDTLREAAEWMDRQRTLWGRFMNAVDDYLKEGTAR
jgi:DNA-binding transcriptional ArsR family regulator